MGYVEEFPVTASRDVTKTKIGSPKRLLAGYRRLFRGDKAIMWRFFLIPESLYVETLSDPKKSILDQD